MRHAAGVSVLTIAVAVVLVGATPATTSVGGPKATLTSARDLLKAQRNSNAFPSRTVYRVDTALSLLDAALQPARWTSDQPRGNSSGLEALMNMRKALAELTWSGIAIRDATDTVQAAIKSAMASAAHARFDSVFHFIGEGGGPTKWDLWAAEYDLARGDAQAWYLQATAAYIRSFRQLLNAGPCC